MLHSIYALEDTNFIRNHLPNIIKAFPDNISKWMCNTSSDKATFSNAAPFYNDILSASWYKENLTYQKDLPPSNKVKQRKIIWLNPPYSVNRETNIGKTFLTLLDKHFPKTNKFHKIFNKNNVKVSYSCLPNFKHTTTESCMRRKPKTNLNVIVNRKMLVL